ncbi:MAG: hypothetical protein B7Z06_06370 [Flavobacteriales bacterium 32-35-8]|nr:MAG: hypothetical protein B7Z06_06370 [Flavobacteriales bacterium 32-35-8]
MSNRDTIFIGHATPEDNEFTLWLQSKLIGEGYKCECDLSFLIGGEADYWKSLQDFLEKQTIKYILVVSEATFEKAGVLDEWEQCKSIEKQFKIADFIIPVKIDKAPFNARIGLNRRNIVIFENNWATGLKRLLKKLVNDNVPKNNEKSTPLSDWYENVYTNWSGVDKKYNDTFYSNWINIPRLPLIIFFYKFHNEKQAKEVLKNNMVYPAYRHGNIIVSFQKSLDYYLMDKGFELTPIEIIQKNTIDAFNWYEDNDFPTYHDFRRLLVRLVNTCFDMYLQSLELQEYELSNSKCYYFEHNDNDKVKGSFNVGLKKHNIGVTGKYYDDFWHFAISFKTLLAPEFCISIKNHIIFTSDGKSAWDDNKKMHIARRRKGKTMFNKEWRNQLLAFLSALSNNDNSKMSVIVAESEIIEFSTTPILFNADFGYEEPNDEKRLMPIDSYLDEEEYYQEIDNATDNA